MTNSVPVTGKHEAGSRQNRSGYGFLSTRRDRRVAMSDKISGIIATNATAFLRETLVSGSQEPGGLSGKPLRALATSFVGHLYRAVGGKLPIIGVGGIFSADDAYEKIRAGASAVQIYTGFIYEGPAVVKRINQGLIRLMERDGFKSISEALGIEA